MNTLVVYDSAHGNTKAIASAIGSKFLSQTTAVMPVSFMDKIDLSQVDLLIVGSPTYGGRPTPAIQKFLTSLSEVGLIGKKVAAFDTRFQASDQRFGLRLLMKIIGYAAPKIERLLIKKGGNLASPAAGFIVITKEGPLAEGELERAENWATQFTTI